MRAIWLGLLCVTIASGQIQQQPVVVPKPTLGSEYLRRGTQLRMAGDLAGAEKEFRAMAQMAEPDGLMGTASLSALLISQNRMGEIEAIWQAGFDRTKDRIYLVAGAGALGRNGKTEAARKMLAPLTKAMEAGESLSPDVARNLAQAYQAVGDQELTVKAARLWQSGVREDQTPNGKGQRIFAAVFLAKALDDAGRALEAETEYEILYDEFPKQRFVLNNYAYHLAGHNKKLDKALELAQAAEKAGTQGIAVPVFEQELVGLILTRMGRSEEAVDYLVKRWRNPERAPVGEIERPSIQVHLAQALAKRRDRSENMGRLLEELNKEAGQSNKVEIERLLVAIGE